MRTIAFYLPQFHTIPENDEWWGKGFTEWTNVRRARPLFEDHQHPKRSTLLGEYDLTDKEVGRLQSEMAKSNGIDAFCMYFYWFGGRRLLEKPVENWRSDSTLLPYCLSWANESWTRRWDGKSKHVLMDQGYPPGFENSLFADLLPHFTAKHYIRQQGRPILLVHKANLIPNPRAFAERMSALAQEAGLPGLHLVAAETTYGLSPEALGFDAVAEFPPVGANTLSSAQWLPVRGMSRDFRGRLLSYGRAARRYTARRTPSFVRYRGVMPGWDNTARRMTEATIYVGSGIV